MSSPLLKLGAFGLGLAVVFTAALGLGRAVGPEPAPAAPVAAHDAQHAPGDGPAPAAAEVVGGLQITQDGYRLAPLSATLSTGAAQPFRFRILGPDHRPVTAYT